MKKITQYGLYGIILLLVAVGVYFSISSFSVISNDNNGVDFPKISCETQQDCINTIVNEYDFPQDELNEQMKTVDLFCENNLCGVREK